MHSIMWEIVVVILLCITAGLNLWSLHQLKKSDPKNPQIIDQKNHAVRRLTIDVVGIVAMMIISLMGIH